MYFEFEVTNNNEVDSEFTKSKTNNNDSKTENANLAFQLEMSLPISTSALVGKKNMVASNFSSTFPPNSSLSNQSSASLKSHFFSPLILPSTPHISPQRHRRYSIHSSPISVNLSSLQDNDNVSFCDLALITKKKILQLNNNMKSLNEEIIDPVVKLGPNKQNFDLRREVLLASVQRSLTLSSDDLSLSPSNNLFAGLKGLNDKNDIEIEDLSMEIVTSNSINSNNNIAKSLFSHGKNILLSPTGTSDEMMSDSFEIKKSLCSRIKARRSLSSSNYTPMENQINCKFI